MSTSSERLRRLQQIVESGEPMDRLGRLQEITQGQTGTAPSAAPQPPGGGGIDKSGLARTLAQGATLGFGEEIEGGLAALGAMVPGGRSPGEAYREQVTGAREDIGQFREEHPVMSTAAELGGAVLPSLLPIPGARAGLARVATTALRNPLGRAAAEGAVAGAGAAEGGVGERLKGAAVGGTVGGVAGKLAGSVGRKFARPRRAAGEALEDVVRREGSSLAELGGRMQPGQILPEAAERGGPIQALTREVTATQEPGGRTLRRTIQERAGRVPGEVSEVLETQTGLGAQDVFRTAEDLAAAKRTNAAPLYEQAYAHGTVDNPEILKLIQEKPSLQDAYRAAQKTAAEEGVPLAPLDAPDVRTLHMMKEELDDLIRRADRSTDISAPSARQTRAMAETKGSLLGLLEGEVPEYRQARLQFAGDAAVMDAFEAAREGSKRLGLKPFLREDPRRIERALSEMTPSEQEFYRRSALDAVVNLPPERRTKLVLNEDPQVQRKLRQLFQDDEAFARFREELAAPQARRQLGRLAGRASQAPKGSLAGPGASERVRRGLGGALMTGIAPLRGRAAVARAIAGGGLSPKATSELGTLLAEATPETLEELEKRLLRARTLVPGTVGAKTGLEMGRLQNR